MKKTLIIRLEACILNESASSSHQFPLLQPGVIQYLGRLSAELGYVLTGLLDNGTAFAAKTGMLSWFQAVLEGEGIVFTDQLVWFPNQPTAEGGPSGELSQSKKALQKKYDLENSVLIGIDNNDSLLAQELGCQFINFKLFATFADGEQKGWKQVFNQISLLARKVSMTRNTSETHVKVAVNLDGHGQANISTGLPFLDHMLDQLCRHGGLDLEIIARELVADDHHHVTEDVAIALGSAIKDALGSKFGIERYGFVLPMDDSLAQVAIDFGGRSWLSWEVPLQRTTIGDIPAEMFRHFFHSFTENARCNLHISATGDNDHHLIESVFKAFARALRQAVAKSNFNTLPSTKGIL